MDIVEIRLRNLERLVTEAGNAAELGRRSKTDPAYISQLRTGVKTATGKRRSVGDDVARRLEGAMDKPHGWMDQSPDIVYRDELSAQQAQVLHAELQHAFGLWLRERLSPEAMARLHAQLGDALESVLSEGLVSRDTAVHIGHELGMSVEAVQAKARELGGPQLTRLDVRARASWDDTSRDSDRHVHVGGQGGPLVYVGRIVGGQGGPLVYVGRIVGAHLAAGTGEIIYDLDEVPLSRAYDAQWMREARLNPDHCKVWPVRGESMFPTVPHGSHVLIDMRSREPKHDRIFAIVGEDGLRLKRLLRRSDGVWEIHSDNQMKISFPTELYVPGKVAIFGQCRDIATPLPA